MPYLERSTEPTWSVLTFLYDSYTARIMLIIPLPSPIIQVRNAYLHRFGGVYADLDLVALTPIQTHLPILQRDRSSDPITIAYVGHMGSDSYEHSIPNAFMISTKPGHPFWLQTMDFVKKHQNEPSYTFQPESLTGPVALRTCVKNWQKNKKQREKHAVYDELIVLENGKVGDCPYSLLLLCR